MTVDELSVFRAEKECIKSNIFFFTPYRKNFECYNRQMKCIMLIRTSFNFNNILKTWPTKFCKKNLIYSYIFSTNKNLIIATNNRVKKLKKNYCYLSKYKICCLIYLFYIFHPFIQNKCPWLMLLLDSSFSFSL